MSLLADGCSGLGVISPALMRGETPSACDHRLCFSLLIAKLAAQATRKQCSVVQRQLNSYLLCMRACPQCSCAQATLGPRDKASDLDKVPGDLKEQFTLAESRSGAAGLQ